MRIAIINPPQPVGARVPGVVLPPLDYLAIAAPSLGDGDEVVLIDGDLDTDDINVIAAEAAASSPDVVVIGQLRTGPEWRGAAHPALAELLEILQPLIPNARIVCGGVVAKQDMTRPLEGKRGTFLR